MCIHHDPDGGLQPPPPFDSLNLARGLGDSESTVRANRRALCEGLGLPTHPVWLRQVHGASCTEVGPSGPSQEAADAGVIRQPGIVVGVLTADCLPILLATEEGCAGAVIHAGWRGLAAGVIEDTAVQLGPGDQLHAYLGPAIGPGAFEVGPEVRQAFVDRNPADAVAFTGSGRYWRADLYQLARLRLEHLGLKAERIAGGDHCTFREIEHFFSYRRDGQTGRMATLIWLASSA